MPRKTKETEFSKESKALTVAQAGPSPAMLALFEKKEFDVKKLQRRNLPQLVKPEVLPVGGTMIAEILDVVNSPNSTIKGKLLWLKPYDVHGDKFVPSEAVGEFTFPCTGVIRSALAPGVKDDDEKLQEILKKECGKILIVRRQEDKQSKYGKGMFVFEVWTVDKGSKAA